MIDGATVLSPAIPALPQSTLPGPEPQASPISQVPSPISSSSPRSKDAHPEVTPLVLSIGGRHWSIRSKTVLGRNGDIAIEEFRKSLEVSRMHCEIEPDHNTWRLRVLSTSSTTVINGTALLAGQMTNLNPGVNHLRLGPSFAMEITVPSQATSDEEIRIDAPHVKEPVIGALAQRLVQEKA